MNVLFIGGTDGTACSLLYYTAMVRLGFRALPWDPRLVETRGLWDRVRMRLAKAPAESRRRWAGDHLLNLCRRNRFDAVFLMAENFIPVESIRAIKALDRPPRFLYHSHDNNYAPGILKPPEFFEMLAELDLVFTTKSQNVERYRRDGVRHAHYLPSAYDPDLHRPVPPGESRLGGRRFDVVFVGTYARSRDPFLDAVGWDRLHVWGSRWDRYPEAHRHGDRITRRPIYLFEQADVLSHCRLALGLLREEAEDLHTQRTFEIPACGALQVAPRNDEIRSYFEEDREIVLFGSPEELREKVDYYLSHPEAAARLQQNGYRRVVDGKHTYRDRVAEMFRRMESAQEAVKTAAS